MPVTYRFADYLSATNSSKQAVNCGQLYPEPEQDQNGRIVPVAPIITKVPSRELAARLRRPQCAI